MQQKTVTAGRQGFIHLFLPFFIIAVLAVGALIFFATKGRDDKSNDYKEKGDIKKLSQWEKERRKAENSIDYYPEVSEVKECPQNLTGVLDNYYIKPEDLSNIIPLGNLGSSHIIPTDHIYFNFNRDSKNLSKVTNIYAPGNAVITRITEMIYTYKSDGHVVHNYTMDFYPCKGLRLTPYHILTLSDRYQEILKKANRQCDSGKDAHLNEFDIQNCNYDFKENQKMVSGELIGTAGGGNVVRGTDVDLGAYNYNDPKPAFANPERYFNLEWSMLHTTCPLDLFSEEIKNEYYTLLGMANINVNTGQIDNMKRTIEPLCGTIMQDVGGTLQGNWFKKGVSREEAGRSENQLSLVHDNIDPSQAVMNMGYLFKDPRRNQFTPKHEGAVDREFSEVKPGNTVYCYQTESQKVLIQLVDASNIKIEQKSGSCSSNESFANPYLFER